jgi:aminomuconate-semialdehyde/2-hydroxymuconate-6-semialdehyde dehydrogenase
VAPRVQHPLQTIANLIDGSPAAPISDQYLDNVEPATGAVSSRLPDSDERDVDRAVEAAKRAFRGWSRTPAAERSRIMLRLAELLESRLEDFAQAESIDAGKPIALARSLDIPRAVANLRFFATAILHASSEAHITDRRAINYTLRQPRGVAGCISPWNLPLYLFTWKIAPALATGNTVVAKPSELAPMTASMLGDLCDQAGLPPGVLNIVHGLGARAGAAIVAHPDVPAITFTGGTVTGAGIARTAAPMFKKLSLELGGKNPNIIFADADFDAAVATSIRAAFSNSGQICLCGSRILVEKRIHDRFVSAFVEGTQRLRIGDPLDETVDLGALISAAHLRKVESYVQLARDEGGTIVCGRGRPATVPARCSVGFFLEPTVITGLPAACRTNQEEIFGPVVTIMPFEDEGDAVALANSTPYGLAATLWTRDAQRAHRVAGAIDAGTVWVNCWLLRDLRVPFGGMKASGVGREGGEEALRFFTEPKNVCIAIE